MAIFCPVHVVPRPFVYVALAAQRGQVQEPVSAQHDIGAYPVGRIRVVDPAVVANEDTDALPVGTVGRHVSQPLALEGGFVFVVVFDRRYRLVVADMQVVVEVTALRRVPRQVPAHARLELAQTLIRRARHQHQRGIRTLIQVDRIWHVVHSERATRATLVDVVQPHEVVDDELAAAFEQIDEPDCALWALERIVLVDLDGGKRTPLLGKGSELPARGFLLRQQIQTSRKPLLPRSDPGNFHHRSYPPYEPTMVIDLKSGGPTKRSPMCSWNRRKAAVWVSGSSFDSATATCRNPTRSSSANTM